MNNVYFACRTCKTYHDAGYRWCYWQLEDPGIVQRGRPVDVRAVMNSAAYWQLPEEGPVDWLRELLPKVRAYLERHKAHELVYGEFEDLSTVPMYNDDFELLEWIEEGDDSPERFIPRSFVERLGYKSWQAVVDYVEHSEQKPWWWDDSEMRAKAWEKFDALRGASGEERSQ